MLRVKHKDWEASFRLDQAEKEASQLPAPTSATEANPTAEEESRFKQIANISPRAAIMERRREIEEALSNLALKHGIDGRKAPMLQMIRILRGSEGIIDPNTSALLDDLRAIGNTAAHFNSSTRLSR